MTSKELAQRLLAIETQIRFAAVDLRNRETAGALGHTEIAHHRVKQLLAEVQRAVERCEAVLA